MKLHYLLFLFFILPAIASCQTSKKAKTSKTAKTDSVKVQTVQLGYAPVAVNECHVKAVVKSIYPKGYGGLTGDVCDTLPCSAEIEILAVNGVGQGFNVNLNAGNILTTSFTYTLTATGKLYPGLNPPLPGLNTGDTFVANIGVFPMQGGGFKFYITDYKKENKQ